ncbi:MAG: hypothetical protein A2Y33_13485 [Spirochaetes bacterium GWF1_51_8]|nr:MAG: hypothetical protein A2Y33_13485 [Spirochaetes bacterium GWF1_51_8]
MWKLILPVIFIFILRAYPVIIRADIPDQEYIEYAKSSFFIPGLVVTRPEAPIHGSGVVIGQNFILTAGHIGSKDGPAGMPVIFQQKEYFVDHVFLFPGYISNQNSASGCDLAILHIKGNGISYIEPAKIWKGEVKTGMQVFGVGQGKSGTGVQKTDTVSGGVFRGYQNTIDFIGDNAHYNILITDFDGPGNTGNSLASKVYAFDQEIDGDSSPAPLPLEGTLGAGDSGSGIWIKKDNFYYLVGIAAGRYYSCYNAQSLYVNLCNPEIYRWIRSVAGDYEIKE